MNHISGFKHKNQIQKSYNNLILWEWGNYKTKQLLAIWLTEYLASNILTPAPVSAEQTLIPPRNGFLYLLFIPQGTCPKLCTRKSVHIFASLRILKSLLYVNSFIPKLFQSIGSISIFLVHFWFIFNKGIRYFIITLLTTQLRQAASFFSQLFSVRNRVCKSTSVWKSCSLKITFFFFFKGSFWIQGKNVIIFHLLTQDRISSPQWKNFKTHCSNNILTLDGERSYFSGNTFLRG